jgi:GR25 family glycosyltransferase involved in LPS biosynthesis
MFLFPLKVCINLDRRPERWQRMQRAFADQCIGPVHRFSAIDGNNVALPHDWIHTAGAYGCLRSHVEVVREARDARASSVLIFEDDVVFDPEFKEKSATFIQELPDDWDMLFLGALHKDEPVKTAEHIGRITKANSTFAYAIRNTVFDAFIELNSRAQHVLDMNNYVLQERFNCYCFMPNLVWVESEYSDVQNRLENHWYLEKSLVLFGNHMDQLLSQTQIMIAPGSQNLDFLVDYYREYFAPLVSIEVGNADLQKEFRVLIDDDIYLEAMDIRANLLMCEEYDAATGFSRLIELTPEQTDSLRRQRITRGVNIRNNPFSKNDRCHFVTRGPITKIFNSPNHALRLSGGSTNRR